MTHVNDSLDEYTMYMRQNCNRDVSENRHLFGVVLDYYDEDNEDDEKSAHLITKKETVLTRMPTNLNNS